MSGWNARIIEEFRTSGGRVGGPFAGKPLLLLHHVGARTGTDRVSPLMYQAVPGGYAVFASKGGADSDPDWLHNLRANPDATVELGTETIPVRARIAGDEEREPIWAQQKSEHRQFAEYEAATDRQIPVVILEPR